MKKPTNSLDFLAKRLKYESKGARAEQEMGYPVLQINTIAYLIQHEIFICKPVRF